MAGAVEIARVYGVDRDVPETRGEQLDLRLARGRHVPVPVPLHDAIAVPLGLRVPYEINFRHECASIALTDATRYSIIIQ